MTTQSLPLLCGALYKTFIFSLKKSRLYLTRRWSERKIRSTNVKYVRVHENITHIFLKHEWCTCFKFVVLYKKKNIVFDDIYCVLRHTLKNRCQPFYLKHKRLLCPWIRLTTYDRFYLKVFCNHQFKETSFLT